jgi:hypothetical protein
MNLHQGLHRIPQTYAFTVQRISIDYFRTKNEVKTYTQMIYLNSDPHICHQKYVMYKIIMSING